MQCGMQAANVAVWAAAWLCGWGAVSSGADDCTLPSTSPAVVVYPVDGAPFAGTLQTLDPQALTVQRDGRELAIELAQLRALAGSAADARPASNSWLILSNGDRVPLTPHGMTDDHLLCRWRSGSDRPDWSVPLERVTGAILRPLSGDVGDSLLRELSFRRFDADVLVLNDRTRVAGELQSVTPQGMQLQTPVGPVDVDAERVHGLALNSALVELPAAGGSAVLIELSGGAWLTLEELSIDAAGVLLGRTDFGATLQASAQDLVRATFFHASVADLTRRSPAAIETVPYVTRSLPPLINRNVRGGFLRLDGREYARGIGMTSGTRMTFDLEEADRRFQALVGLDDEAGAGGSAVFVVELDGRPIFTSDRLTGRDPPVMIGPLDLAGGRRLTLAVEFAEFGNILDLADWCDPVLLH